MSFEIPETLYYLETHEWTAVEGGIATVGITDFAQDELGDVVFVELPAVGEQLTAGEQFGIVESIKAASDLYSAVSGEVVAINEELQNAPELVNQDPYGDGWMITVELTAGGAPEGAMSAAEYRAQTE